MTLSKRSTANSLVEKATETDYTFSDGYITIGRSEKAGRKKRRVVLQRMAAVERASSFNSVSCFSDDMR